MKSDLVWSLQSEVRSGLVRFSLTSGPIQSGVWSNSVRRLVRSDLIQWSNKNTISLCCPGPPRTPAGERGESGGGHPAFPLPRSRRHPQLGLCGGEERGGARVPAIPLARPRRRLQLEGYGGGGRGGGGAPVSPLLRVHRHLQLDVHGGGQRGEGRGSAGLLVPPLPHPQHRLQLDALAGGTRGGGRESVRYFVCAVSVSV